MLDEEFILIVPLAYQLQFGLTNRECQHNLSRQRREQKALDVMRYFRSESLKNILNRTETLNRDHDFN
jgi:hypothetical protein